MNIVKPSSDDDTAVIGAEIDGEFYPCVDVDCDQYYQDSKPFAEWLAAINEHGIELLDTLEAQAKQIEELQADAESMNDALLKVARMAEALRREQDEKLRYELDAAAAIKLRKRHNATAHKGNV